MSVAQKLDVALLSKPEETVSTTQSNWRNVRLPAYTPVTGEALRQLSMPVGFELRGDGQFQDIVVDTQDGDWSLNFKKAVAALFQTKSIQLNNGVHTNQVGILLIIMEIELFLSLHIYHCTEQC